MKNNHLSKPMNRYEHHFSGSGNLALALEDAVGLAIQPIILLQHYLDESALKERHGDPRDYLHFLVGVVSTTVNQMKDDIEYVLRLAGEARNNPKAKVS
jgi:hypothetical protein